MWDDFHGFLTLEHQFCTGDTGFEAGMVPFLSSIGISVVWDLQSGGMASLGSAMRTESMEESTALLML